MISDSFSDWYQENWQTLQQEVRRISAYLEVYARGETLETPLPVSIPETSALAQLGVKFRLSAFERDILLLCVGMEIDPNFATLCAKVNGNSQQNYPTLSLAIAVLPAASWSVFSPQSSLQYWQLIEFAPGFVLSQTPIRIDQSILCYLLGEEAFDSSLGGIVHFNPRFTSISLSVSHQFLAEKLIANWSKSSPHLPIIQLCSREFSSNYQIADYIGQKLGFRLGMMSTTIIPTQFNDLYQLQKKWERESILGDHILFLSCDLSALSDPYKKTAIAFLIENLRTPLILSTQERLNSEDRSIITVDVPPLKSHEQKQIWESYLDSLTPELNGYLDQLVTQFNLTPQGIYSACLQINPDENTSIKEQLWGLCCSQARPRLEDLAQRIESQAGWDDLILPERQKHTLYQMVAHLRQRHKVYEKWGFSAQEKRGLGMSALFSGQSGTGKTMAAGVLARELKLDLYRIDLSAVVSKYIGETEKNLRRIFDAAESGGAILLFDEADALFGKRTEVRDSHDRHANVEVSYLLQRMEAYQGLAILTTNLKNSLDTAFLRRIRFIVAFPFPDIESRIEIWRRVFPPQTPIEDLNFQKLGKLNIAGGYIRNIAFNAAILAADADEPVMMKHILQATQSEYIKLEIPLPEI